MSAIAPPPIEVEPWQSLARNQGGGEQHIYRFTNGYGASVIRGPYSYGGTSGLYELAVIEFDCPTGVWSGNDQWQLTYGTSITNDVIGHLTVPEVAALLLRIAALPSAVAAIEAGEPS